MAANVTNYQAYRTSATRGQIELVGSGFGATPGRVNLVQVVKPVEGPEVILSWSDTKIVLEVPAYAAYRHFMVVPDGGGAFTATNLNPQPTTNLLRGVIWDTAYAGPLPDEVVIEGSGLSILGMIYLGVTVRSGIPVKNPYLDPDGQAFNDHYGITVVTWDDSTIDVVVPELGDNTIPYIIGFIGVNGEGGENTFNNVDFSVTAA